MSSFRIRWQPVRSEDERTAMVFGFFKHAPASLALEPWLAELVQPDKPVEVEPLRSGAFWPSQTDGASRIVPDLCFVVRTERGRRIVLVEAKRSTEHHTTRQLAAEARAAATLYPATPILVITVGSRLDPRSRTSELRSRVPELDLSHRHVPWASLGRVLAGVRHRDSEWGRYADDICMRMRRLGLLNEPGLPPIAVEARAAVDAVNDLNQAARDLLRLVNDAVAKPLDCQLAGREIWGTGREVNVDRSPFWLRCGVVFGSWALPNWPESRRVFVAVDLRSEGGPSILVGPAWAANNRLIEMMHEGDPSLPVRNRELDAHAAHFAGRRAHQGVSNVRDFRFNTRAWSADGEGDLAWIKAEFEVALSAAASVNGEEPENWTTATIEP